MWYDTFAKLSTRLLLPSNVVALFKVVGANNSPPTDRDLPLHDVSLDGNDPPLQKFGIFWYVVKKHDSILNGSPSTSNAKRDTAVVMISRSTSSAFFLLGRHSQVALSS